MKYLKLPLNFTKYSGCYFKTTLPCFFKYYTKL